MMLQRARTMVPLECGSYEAAINYHIAYENSRAPSLPKNFHAMYTAEGTF